MYARGNAVNVEYKRKVDTFFRGIVVDTEDPNKQLRVRVFIPELVNHDFFKDQGFDTLKFGAPQKDTHIDRALVEKIKDLIPWAEQSSPLMGEIGPSHWNHPTGMQWSPTNYGNPPTSNTAKVGWGKGRAAQMPREALANSSKQPGNSIAGDKFINPKQTGLPYLNPSGSSYMPVNSGPRASGLYGRPQLGSQVWVFFEHGDLNFPIYFAGIPSYKETAQVNIPTGGPFENGVGETETDVEDTPPSSSASGLYKSGSDTKVDARKLQSYIEGQILNSSLNNNPPKDGAKFGIPTGSSQEWARYFTRLAYLESGHAPGTVGDVGSFVGNSNGLFQLSPNDALNWNLQSTPFTIEQLQNPEFNINAAISIHEGLLREDNVIARGNRGASRYWGPLQPARENSTHQYHAASWYGNKGRQYITR